MAPSFPAFALSLFYSIESARRKNGLRSFFIRVSHVRTSRNNGKAWHGMHAYIESALRGKTEAPLCHIRLYTFHLGLNTTSIICRYKCQQLSTQNYWCGLKAPKVEK